jgi:hypothetical protein
MNPSPIAAARDAYAMAACWLDGDTVGLGVLLDGIVANEDAVTAACHAAVSGILLEVQRFGPERVALLLVSVSALTAEVPSESTVTDAARELLVTGDGAACATTIAQLLVRYGLRGGCSAAAAALAVAVEVVCADRDEDPQVLARRRLVSFAAREIANS